jgi:hypothetical protein
LSKYLEIGSFGWLHDGWLDKFYPDELPEDWQLSYYANEFRFVVIPCDQWIQAERDEMEQWLEDVHDNFHFMVELNHAALVDGRAQLDTLLGVLSGRVCGFIYRDTADALAEDVSLLKSFNQTAMVHVDVPGNENRERILQQDLLPCWRDGEADAGKGARLGFVPHSDELSNQRELRKIMQSFLENANDSGDFFMVFEGEPPHIKAMQDAVVIAELLGV